MGTIDKIKQSGISFVAWVKEWPPRIVLIVGAIIIFALLFTLTGCRSPREAYSGTPKVYGIVGCGGAARHTLETSVGAGCHWDSGAEVELTYRPWWRVEEPSSRGFPGEKVRVFVEAKYPLN